MIALLLLCLSVVGQVLVSEAPSAPTHSMAGNLSPFAFCGLGDNTTWMYQLHLDLMPESAMPFICDLSAAKILKLHALTKQLSTGVHEAPKMSGLDPLELNELTHQAHDVVVDADRFRRDFSTQHRCVNQLLPWYDVTRSFFLLNPEDSFIATRLVDMNGHKSPLWEDAINNIYPLGLHFVVLDQMDSSLIKPSLGSEQYRMAPLSWVRHVLSRKAPKGLGRIDGLEPRTEVVEPRGCLHSLIISFELETRRIELAKHYELIPILLEESINQLLADWTETWKLRTDTHDPRWLMDMMRGITKGLTSLLTEGHDTNSNSSWIKPIDDRFSQSAGDEVKRKYRDFINKSISVSRYIYGRDAAQIETSPPFADEKPSSFRQVKPIAADSGLVDDETSIMSVLLWVLTFLIILLFCAAMLRRSRKRKSQRVLGDDTDLGLFRRFRKAIGLKADSARIISWKSSEINDESPVRSQQYQTPHVEKDPLGPTYGSFSPRTPSTATRMSTISSVAPNALIPPPLVVPKMMTPDSVSSSSSSSTLSSGIFPDKNIALAAPPSTSSVVEDQKAAKLRAKAYYQEVTIVNQTPEEQIRGQILKQQKYYTKKKDEYNAVVYGNE